MFLYVYNLIALRKPDGGVRPIAIGNTKAVSFLMFHSFGDKLRPIQLGCGTKAGCEAAIHVSTTFCTMQVRSSVEVGLPKRV